MNRMWAIVERELRKFFRSPALMLVAMVFPLVQLIVLGNAFGDGIAEQITCPTLVCDADEDTFFDGQPEMLFDHLTCQKALLDFTAAEGAGAHCQSGAQRLAFGRIYDWLDDVLRVG